MTTLYEGVSGLRVVVDPDAGTYPAWQPGRHISITKTVGGFAATMLSGIAPSEATSTMKNTIQVASFIWNGVEFCRAPDSGSGSGFELYALANAGESAWHRWNAVEPGKSGEQPPNEGTANMLAQGLTDASGANMIRIVKPCFWIGQGETSIPGHMAQNMREVSEAVATITYTWGLGGNDHIILIDHSIVIPVDPTVQSQTQLSLVPWFHYSPNFGAKPFTTQEWVNLTTGATRAYTPGDTSTTETLMGKTADENFAVAIVYGAGALGTGYYTGFSGTGPFPYLNAYGFGIKAYPGGIPAGVVRSPVGFCFGTRADLIGGGGAIVTAAANLPAASYP